jgi:hypothetical protein
VYKEAYWQKQRKEIPISNFLQQKINYYFSQFILEKVFELHICTFTHLSAKKNKK